MLLLALSVPIGASAQVAEPGLQIETSAASEAGEQTFAEASAVTRAATPASDASPQCESTPRPERFTLVIGFSHWFGETFGSPAGVTTPALTLGWVPLAWLELQVNYTLSVAELTVPDGSVSRVGFATVALLLRRALEVDGERLVFAGGIAGGIVHTKNGVRPALGVAIAARYLIRISEGLSLGPVIDARAMLYQLPESDRAIRNGHSDLLFQIGVAAAF